MRSSLPISTVWALPTKSPASSGGAQQTAAGVSTRGHGQREGPAGDKFCRRQDAGNGGRVRSDAKRNGAPRTPSARGGSPVVHSSLASFYARPNSQDTAAQQLANQNRRKTTTMRPVETPPGIRRAGAAVQRPKRIARNKEDSQNMRTFAPWISRRSKQSHSTWTES
jgi:hypothetical protein